MKVMFKLGLIITMMLTPVLVSWFFSFQYKLIHGQYLVYGLSSLSIMVGLWMIKTDFIDQIEE